MKDFLIVVLCFFFIVDFSSSQPNITLILDQINFVRTNPSQYAQMIQQNYSNFNRYKWFANGTLWNTIEGLNAVLNTISNLQNILPMNSLNLSVGISAAAQLHANTLYGNATLLTNPYFGCLNHTVIERITTVGSWNSIAESIVGGVANEELIVANLIISDGDINRGNRFNVLNPLFTHIGIGIINETNLTNLVVIDYAQNFICNKLCANIPNNGTYQCAPNPYDYSFSDKILINVIFSGLFLCYLLI